MAERRPLVLINGVPQELPLGDTVPMNYRIWQAGVLHFKGETVRSSLDFELYTRIADTGTDTVDPADDLTKYVATSYVRMTGLSVTAAIHTQLSASAANFANGATKLSVGAITVGTRTEVLSVTGKGAIGYLGFLKATANGGRIELAIDGRGLIDVTAGSLATDALVVLGSSGFGIVSANNYYAYNAIAGSYVEFKRSLSVHYTPAGTATSLNSTLAYMLRADA